MIANEDHSSVIQLPYTFTNEKVTLGAKILGQRFEPKTRAFEQKIFEASKKCSLGAGKRLICAIQAVQIKWPFKALYHSAFELVFSARSMA